jgi:hypothetical protein
MANCIVVSVGENKYSCQINDDYNGIIQLIKLIIKEYINYKDYIKDFLSFLNAIKNGWIIGHSRFCISNLGYTIHIRKSKVNVYGSNNMSEEYKIQKVITPEFIEFINRRFLLKYICDKYDVPKDIQNYLVNFF